MADWIKNLLSYKQKLNELTILKNFLDSTKDMFKEEQNYMRTLTNDYYNNINENRKYRECFDSCECLGYMIICADVNEKFGQIQAVNNKTKNILGCSKNDLESKYLFNIIDTNDYKEFILHLRNLITKKEETITLPCSFLSLNNKKISNPYIVEILYKKHSFSQYFIIKIHPNE